MSMPLHNAALTSIKGRGQGLLWIRKFHISSTQSHVGTHGVLGNFRHENDDMVFRLFETVKLLAGSIS
eukprot:Skav230751  [mRNA]  locus=scaffold3436:161165:161757:+ [translate_table: standard]